LLHFLVLLLEILGNHRKVGRDRVPDPVELGELSRGVHVAVEVVERGDGVEVIVVAGEGLGNTELLLEILLVRATREVGRQGLLEGQDPRVVGLLKGVRLLLEARILVLLPERADGTHGRQPWKVVARARCACEMVVRLMEREGRRRGWGLEYEA